MSRCVRMPADPEDGVRSPGAGAAAAESHLRWVLGTELE